MILDNVGPEESVHENLTERNFDEREIRYELWLLKSHLKSKGVEGTEIEDGHALCIADPLDPDKKIIVRDGVAFGYKPTIEGERPAIEYAKHFSVEEIPEFNWLGELDKLELMVRQEECSIPPDDLATPNPIIVAEARRRDEALGAALRLNSRLSFVVIGKNCHVHDAVTGNMMTAPAIKALLASDQYISEKVVPVINKDGTPKVKPNGEPVTRIKEELRDSFLAWNESPLRRTYYGVEFAPNNRTATGEARNPSKLNKWTGFECFRVPTIVVPTHETASIILDHMEKVFHNGNSETFKYECQWLAHMLRHPEEKPHAHIIRFEPTGGTGKDIFGNMLRFKIVGTEHSTTASGNDQLCDNFNANFEVAVLIVGNEIAWGKNIKSRHKLYDETASVVRQIEPKGVDRYEVYNYTRYLLHSNDINPVNVQKGDRRFLTLRCYDLAQDYEAGKSDPRYEGYYKELGRACSDPAIVRAFVHHLMELDLSDFNRFRAPDTAAKHELVELNLTEEHKWLLHLARCGQIQDSHQILELHEDSNTLVPKRAAQEAARDHFSQREKALETVVGKALCADGLVRTVERRRDEGKKVRFYVFPPLPEFRSKVAKIVGLTVEECTGSWEPVTDEELGDAKEASKLDVGDTY